MKKSKKIDKYEGKAFYKIVPITIFGLAGLFYMLAPHEIHVASGLGFGLAHEVHIILGIFLLITAGIFWLLSRNKK